MRSRAGLEWLHVIESCNSSGNPRAPRPRAPAHPPSASVPFIVAGTPLGFVDDARAARLERFGPRLFQVRADRVDARQRSGRRAVALGGDGRRRSDAARRKARSPRWRDERYASRRRSTRRVVLHIERGAARYFGVRTWAVHVNGIVRTARSMSMWLARRSPTKAIDPGMLDNLVGGGISAGLSVEATVVKESWEEAGIGDALAATRASRRHRPCRARAAGRHCSAKPYFVHDLDLPADFRPVNQDGEAIEHRLVDVDDAAPLIAIDAGPDEVTVDASVVVLDFLLRHGRHRVR